MKNSPKVTPREQEVLHLIAHEHSTKEIASKLYVSYETVNSHRKNLLRKMDVKNTAGLVRVGFQYGLLRMAVIGLFFLFQARSMTAQTIGLQVAENHNVLFGTDTTGAGTKLMWLPAKKSFLAGEVNGMRWDPDSIGTHNAIFGLNNKALGNYTTLNGRENTISQLAFHTTLNGWKNTIGQDACYTTLNGFNNTISQFAFFTTLNGWKNTIGQNARFTTLNGQENTIGQDAWFTTLNGEQNTIGQSTDYTTLNGRQNTIGQAAWFTTLNGLQNKAMSSYETIFGRYADTTAVSSYTGAWDGDHQLFALGNGTSDSDRNNAMTVLKNGNVGVNTSQPSANIHIHQISNTAMSEGGLRIEDADSTDWKIYVDDLDDFNFGFEGTLRSFIRDQDGQYVIHSDRRLKNRIKSLESVLDKVNQLNPSSYYYNYSKSERRSLGFIAQEVEKLFPEIITEKNGYKALAYDDFAILSIKAIQEQQEIIDAQQQELQEVKSQNDELIERIERLEQLVLTRE